MRIDPVPPTGGPQKPATPSAAPGGGISFATLLAQEAEAAALVAPVEETVLAPRLGEVANDRAARRHGRAMLNALGALQLAVLDDGTPPARPNARRTRWPTWPTWPAACPRQTTRYCG